MNFTGFQQQKKKKKKKKNRETIKRFAYLPTLIFFGMLAETQIKLRLIKTEERENSCFLCKHKLLHEKNFLYGFQVTLQKRSVNNVDNISIKNNKSCSWC